MDTFKMQDEVFDLLLSDDTFCTLMGITNKSDDDLINSKIRRVIQPTDLLTADGLPFIVEYFYNAHRTGNYLMNKGSFEIDVYTGTRVNTKAIVRQVKALLQSKYEDMNIYHEGYVASGIVGVTQYTLRMIPLVNS